MRKIVHCGNNAEGGCPSEDWAANLLCGFIEPTGSRDRSKHGALAPKRALRTRFFCLCCGLCPFQTALVVWILLFHFLFSSLSPFRFTEQKSLRCRLMVMASALRLEKTIHTSGRLFTKILRAGKRIFIARPISKQVKAIPGRRFWAAFNWRIHL